MLDVEDGSEYTDVGSVSIPRLFTKQTKQDTLFFRTEPPDQLYINTALLLETLYGIDNDLEGQG